MVRFIVASCGLLMFNVGCITTDIQSALDLIALYNTIKGMLPAA